MDTPKSKDKLSARQDLEMLCDRPLLNPVRDKKGKAWIKKGDYTLERVDVKKVCAWLKKLKFPDGYASNIGNCVNIKNGSFYGFKSHDCHVFMQRLFPLAIRGFVPNMVYEAITELCMFFRVLCSKTLHMEDLYNMKRSIAQTICKLEKIFPPSFFDSMEHLIIHLADEAILGGPVQYRWIYQYESGDILSVFAFPSRRLYEKGGKKRPLKHEELHKAHTYILLNCVEVAPFITKFDRAAQASYQNEPISVLRDKYFAEWFKYKVTGDSTDGSAKHLEPLANGPSNNARSYNGYFVNGYKFHTQEYGKGRATNNYGLCVRGEIYNGEESDYYGLLDEILEINYYDIGRSTVVLFKCTWFDNIRGVVVNKNKLVDVKPTSHIETNDPFCLASQAEHVFYTPYPAVTDELKDLWAVVKTKPRGVYEVTKAETEVALDGSTEANGVFHLDERFELPNEVNVSERLSLASNRTNFEQISSDESEGSEAENQEDDTDEDDRDEPFYFDYYPDEDEC
ncbi:uncharacterized protein LOC111879256 [Lactuca sativa]|uniref:uncharacterized protein LOC111879256 n=1 Tax=Lactuca sativa TaxID=4236 RepID=UPI0022AFD55E|nr:uncharacterized protein LOC111879256 [Lactuca sativa]